jgi:mannose-1-phosphate guanylyltransferase/mannose-6-phosphate isomerase
LGLHILVLAGGSGSRLWPVSRAAIPKHLLPLGPGGISLLRATVDRVAGMGQPIRLVTSSEQVEACMRALEGSPVGLEQTIAEPGARGTGPALGLATAAILAGDPDAVICSVHADAHVGDAAAYRAGLAAAGGWAAATGGLVAVGLAPSFPATGFGYIALGDRREPSAWKQPDSLPPGLGEEAAQLEAFASPGFVEKPSLERATQFLHAGTHLWNTGIFAWPAAQFMAELAASSPETAAGVTEAARHLAAGDLQAAAAAYWKVPKQAVEPLVFERSNTLTAIRCAFPWSDLGSWADLSAARRDGGSGDEEGNLLEGDTVVVRSRGCMVSALGGRTVAVVGADDLVVIDVGDAVLVVPADQTQGVREVVERLREAGRTDLI